MAKGVANCCFGSTAVSNKLLTGYSIGCCLADCSIPPIRMPRLTGGKAGWKFQAGFHAALRRQLHDRSSMNWAVVDRSTDPVRSPTERVTDGASDRAARVPADRRLPGISVSLSWAGDSGRHGAVPAGTGSRPCWLPVVGFSLPVAPSPRFRDGRIGARSRRRARGQRGAGRRYPRVGLHRGAMSARSVSGQLRKLATAMVVAPASWAAAIEPRASDTSSRRAPATSRALYGYSRGRCGRRPLGSRQRTCRSHGGPQGGEAANGPLRCRFCPPAPKCRRTVWNYIGSLAV